MGITIHSKNRSIDLGYFGFQRLRQKVADLAAEDVGKHYRELGEHVITSLGTDEDYFREYDRKTEEIAEKYGGKFDKILNFLYEGDWDGSVTYGTCKDLLKVIGDYDDDIKYGYSGREDCAMFKDFKELLQDCVENKCRMRWD